MHTPKALLLLILAISISAPLFSQGELDDEKKIFFRNEKSWAFFIKNNGIGGNYRKGKRINAFKKHIWEVDLHYVKAAKEIKISNSATQLNQFVHGKSNFTLDIRGGVGLQKELFRKIDKNGVAVRYFYTVGPTVLLLKPIYYEVINTSTSDIEIKVYDPGVSGNYLGRASFFRGIDEIKIDPGIYLKAGLSFEYSKQDIKLKALEIGAMAGLYLTEYEIMYGHKSRHLFSLFISFRWGKIIRGGRMEGVEIESE